MLRIVIVVIVVCTLALAGQLDPMGHGVAQDLNPGPATPDALGRITAPVICRSANPPTKTNSQRKNCRSRAT